LLDSLLQEKMYFRRMKLVAMSFLLLPASVFVLGHVLNNPPNQTSAGDELMTVLSATTAHQPVFNINKTALGIDSKYFVKARSTTAPESLEPIDQQNTNTTILGPIFRKGIVNNKPNHENVTANTRDGRNFLDAFSYLSRLLQPIDRSDTIYTDPAEELEPMKYKDLRNLAATALFQIKERFSLLRFEAPVDTDVAVEAITAAIAKSNMLDYTIGTAFLFGAGLDILADLIIEERNIWTLHQQLDFWFLSGFLWGYAIGYGGPFWFGLENPVQDCAGKDLRDLLDDFNFNLDNLAGLSTTQLAIVTKALRLEQNQILYCVLSKSGSSTEAALVGSKLSEMVDITFLYKDLLTMANSEDPVFQTVVKPEDEERLSKQIRDCDAQLDQLWSNFELQVAVAYDFAYSNRKSSNIIKVAIGFINLFANICGVLIVAEVKAATGLPAIADIPPILSEKITNALQGQFTNDFLQGEGVAIVAMNAWAYGYYMPYFFGYENPDPGCGINEFHDVLRNHREFGTFGLTFGSPEHIVQGLFSTTANTLPIFAKYRV